MQTPSQLAAVMEAMSSESSNEQIAYQCFRVTRAFKGDLSKLDLPGVPAAVTEADEDFQATVSQLKTAMNTLGQRIVEGDITQIEQCYVTVINTFAQYLAESLPHLPDGQSEDGSA